MPEQLVGIGVPGDWANLKVLANTPGQVHLPAGSEPDFMRIDNFPSKAGWWLLAAGIGFTTLAAAHYQELQQTRVALSSQTAQPTTSPALSWKATVSAPPKRWADLLPALEEKLPRAIALLSMRADAMSGMVILEAKAKNEEAMLVWLGELRAIPQFRDTLLVRHERQNGEEGQSTAFQVRLQWGSP
jgi:hypothetical protein